MGMAMRSVSLRNPILVCVAQSLMAQLLTFFGNVAAVASLTLYVGPNLDQNTKFIHDSVFIVAIVLPSILFFVVLSFFSRASIKRIGLHFVGLPDIRFLCVLLSLIGYAYVRQLIDEFEPFVLDIYLSVTYFICLCLLVPFTEEMFREHLYTIVRVDYGNRIAIIVSTFIWLAMHLPGGLTNTAILIYPAVILTFVRCSSGNVYQSIICHSAYNMVIFFTTVRNA